MAFPAIAPTAAPWAYARFTGTHAKSDPIDARLLAGDGRDKAGLRLYRPPRPQQAALRGLAARRTDLVRMIGAGRCRLEQARLASQRGEDHQGAPRRARDGAGSDRGRDRGAGGRR